MALEREMMFDLKVTRLNELSGKLIGAIIEFEEEPKKQWTSLRLEKALIEELLDATEKQIPREPVEHGDIEWYFCKVCDALVHNKGNYCHGCGRKIDWGN